MANTKYLKKHELTRPAKVTDRMELSKSINCQISPVMLGTDNKEKFSAQLAKQLPECKTLHEVEYNNYQHKLCLIDKTDQLNVLQEYFDNKNVYIADGHHRSQTQLELHQQ